jgi:hypothetical protein
MNSIYNLNIKIVSIAISDDIVLDADTKTISKRIYDVLASEMKKLNILKLTENNLLVLAPYNSNSLLIVSELDLSANTLIVRSAIVKYSNNLAINIRDVFKKLNWFPKHNRRSSMLIKDREFYLSILMDLEGIVNERKYTQETRQNQHDEDTGIR